MSRRNNAITGACLSLTLTMVAVFATLASAQQTAKAPKSAPVEH